MKELDRLKCSGRGLLIVIFTLTGPSLAANPDPTKTVHVEQGWVRGQRAGSTYVFKGVPYATPPTGSLRWRPPQPPLAWEGTKDAFEFGKVCPQTSIMGDGHSAVIGSEDCLTLNIWTPALEPQIASQRAVMVWIHGGFSNWGSSSVESKRRISLYDGQYLAERGDVVVVTLNYRLGPLGFLAHPALSDETAYHGSGNYGYMDQIAALNWIRRNIAGFGGDPKRVTIFGESAGGTAVLALLASSRARGLFSGAIAQSPGYVGRPLRVAEGYGLQLARVLGCTEQGRAAHCMRSQPAERLIRALPEALEAGGRFYKPNVDGYVLNTSVFEVFRSCRQVDVPFISGVTSSEEITLLRYFISKQAEKITTSTDLESVLLEFLINTSGQVPWARQVAAQAARLYEHLFPHNPQRALVAATSDAQFIAPNRRLMRAVASQRNPTFRYVFAHGFHDDPLRGMGAGHGTELPFEFHSFSSRPAFAPDPGESALSGQVIDYWAQFAKTGDPNVTGHTRWPVYDAAKDTYLELDEVPVAKEGFHRLGCDFWDGVEEWPATAEVILGWGRPSEWQRSACVTPSDPRDRATEPADAGLRLTRQGGRAPIPISGDDPANEDDRSWH